MEIGSLQNSYSNFVCISFKIILVKNPAGYDEAVNTINLDKRKINLSLMLNDNYADGKDVSWIWDVNFERLTNLNINKVMISGIRLYDMAIRLKVAGLSSDSFLLCNDEEALLNEIKTIYFIKTINRVNTSAKIATPSNKKSGRLTAPVILSAASG